MLNHDTGDRCPYSLIVVLTLLRLDLTINRRLLRVLKLPQPTTPAV